MTLQRNRARFAEIESYAEFVKDILQIYVRCCLMIIYKKFKVENNSGSEESERET